MKRRILTLTLLVLSLALTLNGAAHALDGGGLGSASAQFLGEAAGDYAGYSVALVGDVNGDGYDDVLIGASGWWGHWHCWC